MADTSRLIRKSVSRFFPNLLPTEARAKIRDIHQWCEENSIEIISPDSTAFVRLREIGGPPEVLYTRGNSALLPLSSVAVVGTRRPSQYGVRASLAFSAALARRGYAIVSGLAQGIDGAAHRGALLAGGYTIAVVGHGLDRIYPSFHRGLAREIVEKHGCLVSEYPPGVPPLKHHFPERNRILSGLSLGTLVVQAAEQSGSLITARFALEQNREVFVVPANFDDKEFRGSHRLIQDGAKLVTHPDHLSVEFPPLRLIEDPVKDEKGLLLFREIFRRHGGEMDLDEIRRAGGDWREQLDRATAVGLIAEISSQKFCWIGEEGPTFLPVSGA